MRNFTIKRLNSFKLLFFVVLFFVSSQVRAQFPFSQSFQNITAPGIQFGGTPTSFLTAPSIDATGSGYLRLTNTGASQKGFIWSDANAFPSSYGMNISFEYYTYGGTGADGIAFILFDALVSNPTPGGYGGSLGYAQNSVPSNGFQGGYLGVGIDEFGNFPNPNESRVGGPGFLPNNVTLRGQGSGATGYPYLTSAQTTPSFSIAGSDRTATTSASTGFRKVEVILRPRVGGGFFIDVYLIHGATRDLIINNYAYTTATPANLKFAITSSTGGQNNYHEIRNLNITVDPTTLSQPVANPDSFSGCAGLAATSADVTVNDNGAVNTQGTVNKATVDLDTAVAGIQPSKTVAGQGTFTYDSTTGKVTFTPVNNTIAGPVAIDYTFNDSYGKTSTLSTITYTTVATPIANTITAPAITSFCGNGDAANIVGSNPSGGVGGYVYQWQSSTDNITFNNISSTNSKDYDPTSKSVTTYYRRVVTSGTCNTSSNVVTITIDTNPGAASNTTSTTAICESVTKALTATPAGGTWSVFSGSGSISGTTYTPADVAVSTAVTIRYTIPANGSCPQTVSDVTFTVNPGPATPTIMAGGPTTFCLGGSVLLSSSAVSGNQWYKDGVLIAGATSQTYSATTTGDYTVITNNGTCSSLASSATTVTVSLSSAPTVAAPTQPTCAVPTGSVLLSGLPSSGTWTVTRTPGAVTSSGSGTSTTISGLPAGATYTFTVTDAAGCVSASSANVVINTVAGVPITTGITICQGGSGSLTSSTVCPSGFVNSGTTISGAWNGSTDPTALRLSGNFDNEATCAFTNNGHIRNYVAIPFQVSVTENYVFEMNDNNTYDGMGYIVSGAFIPGNCSGGGTFVRGDSDDGAGNEPRLGRNGVGNNRMNLSAGTTYTLISTTDGNTGTYTGSFVWTITPQSSGQIMLQNTGALNWYTTSSSVSSIGSGSPFNPVGVTNSGLPNTNTAGTTTFYAECSSNPGCRAATDFVIKAAPTTANAGPDQTGAATCGLTTVTLDGNTPTVGTGK